MLPDTNSTTVRPRSLTHRGQVPVSGWIFDTRLLGLIEARYRLLRAWIPGALVYRLPEGLLLTLPQATNVRAESVSGLPLVLVGNVWYAAPLTVSERKKLAAPAGSVVLVRGGQAMIVRPGELPTEDPAAYLDLGNTKPVRVSSLGEPPGAVRDVMKNETFDARAKFKNVPPVAEKMKDVLNALRDAQDRPPSEKPVTIPRASDTGGLGQGGLLADFARKMMRSLREITGIASSENPAADDSGRAERQRRIGEMLGQQHAEYMQKMLGLFEKGDLFNALRHAIPMSSLTNPNNEELPPAFGNLAPRDNLNFGPDEKKADSALGFGPDLWIDFQKLYRQAFEKLERDGQIDQAAFVLAELLRANEEAVAFLERHGRLRLAAEMAEARKLPPGMAVRLWFLAGDHERAILLARRTGAWGDAVARLERGDDKQKSQAQTLRMLWAAYLARSGDYAGAIEAAWPVEEGRPLALAWMDRVIELGGPPAARMRVRRLAVPQEKEARQADVESLLETLEGDEPGESRTRAALTEELGRLNLPADSPVFPLVRALARAGIRTLARDVAFAEQGGGPPDSNALGRLVTLSGDASLRTDVPPVPIPVLPVLRTRTEARQIRIEAGDVGTLPVYDATFLPDGRCLVALGEAGVRLLTRDGRTVAHWGQPAHGLVMADNGAHTITTAPRGEATRLGRLDLATRKCEDWCEALLTVAAPDYDGTFWFVQEGDSLLAVDATAPGGNLLALSRLGGVDGTISTIARTTHACSVVREGTGRRPVTEIWTFILPALTLREHKRLESPLPPAHVTYRVTSIGAAVERIAVPGDAPPPAGYGGGDEVTLRAGGASFALDTSGLMGGIVPPFAVTSEWVAAASVGFAGTTIHLLTRTDLKPRAEIALGGASGSVSLRFGFDCLTVGDDRGRVVVLDLATGATRADTRVR